MFFLCIHVYLIVLCLPCVGDHSGHCREWKLLGQEYLAAISVYFYKHHLFGLGSVII